MNNRKKLMTGIISLTLAILLFAVLLIVQASLKKAPECEMVLCAKTQIPKEMRMNEANAEQYLEKRNIPVEWLPEGYLTEWQQVYDRVWDVNMSEGTVLTEAAITAHEDIYDGYRNLTWISVPIKELYQGVAGSLRVGDYVDIYALSKAEEEIVCELLAEKIRIEQTFNTQGQEVEGEYAEGLTQLIVIPMEKELVADFYEKLEQGNIRIAKYEK